MGGRTDVGGDRRFIEPDDIVPASFNQMVGDGSANNAAKPDDNHIRFFRKFSHVNYSRYCA